MIVLNTKEPESVSTSNLVDELFKKYDVNVVPIDATKLSESEIDLILQKSLEEFEITKLDLNIINQMRISTIHSFCRSVLSDFSDIPYNLLKRESEIL